nr:hypothetical protein [Tanacetum cinerariifolium]
MGDDVDINKLTTEQYLALIQDNNRPGIVKPKIGDDIEFEINRNFMMKLKRKLFPGCSSQEANFETLLTCSCVVTMLIQQQLRRNIFSYAVTTSITAQTLSWLRRVFSGNPHETSLAHLSHLVV